MGWTPQDWTAGDASDSPMDKIYEDLWDNDDILLGEDVEQEGRDLSDEERQFLKEFPIFKEELEAAITNFHALADEMDKAHKTFTKVSMVSNTVSVVADVMGILGLVLAPATAGGSLMLSAAATGFGTAAGAASTITDILEYLRKKEIKAQANIQVPDSEHHLATNVAKSAIKFGTNVRNIEKNVLAFQIAKNHPRLAAAAKRLLNAGQVSSKTQKQVQKAFGGTTMVMKHTTRLQKSGMAFFALGIDLMAVMKNKKDLEEGTTELAEELRAKARDVETELTKLTKIYEHLKQKEWQRYWEKILQSKNKDKDQVSDPLHPCGPQDPRSGKSFGRQILEICAFLVFASLLFKCFTYLLYKAMYFLSLALFCVAVYVLATCLTQCTDMKYNCLKFGKGKKGWKSCAFQG
ncbi:apolipoprotein L6 [Artibeus jamaicensis]|uniref:apolipoprotein L6 n=1 Tax=Artibeus jamaicensis TaxID=9417 RepID=UPI00235A66E8|nr:apolipoprotein L6 [Artibeus jamaicensis]